MSFVQLRKNLGWILLLVGVAIAVGLGFLPHPIPVETVAVRRAPLRVTVVEEGKTRVVDRFVVSAPVTGYARRVSLDVGDRVQAGQTVVDLEPARSRVLDPRSRAEAEARVAAASAALLAAEANVRAAEADAAYADAELKRTLRLKEVDAASTETLEQAHSKARQTEARRRSAEFQVDVARHEVQAAQTLLKYSGAEEPSSTDEVVRLTSPVGGNILKLFHESEGAVQAGDPLVEVGDPGALEVEVEVLSADAIRIRPEGRVIFDRWGGEAPLQGRVRVVEPVGFTKISALGVEEQRVLAIVDITSPRTEWERLGDGYRVEASFVLWEGEDVLQVPSSALFRKGDGWAVYSVMDGRAQQRSVTLGHRSGLHAEIVNGLADGELVVPHPSDAISDGASVEVREG